MFARSLCTVDGATATISVSVLNDLYMCVVCGVWCDVLAIYRVCVCVFCYYFDFSYKFVAYL